MNFKLKALAAAASLLAAAGGAQAAVAGSSVVENSSMLFVAYDIVGGTNTSLTVDLGYSFGDFIQGAALNAAGTTVTWNLNTSTVTLNGATVAGDNAWGAATSTFFGTIQAADLRWGVIGYDSVQGGTFDGRGMLSTGNPTQANITGVQASATVGNAITAMNNFYAPTNNLGTHPTNANGANIATSGSAYLNTTVKTNFNGNIPWSYLLADNGVSRLNRVNQLVGNPEVNQLGTVSTVDTVIDLADAATFTFNSATGVLTYSVPAVPEPGTYAMLLAGMAVVGFMARRRRG